MGDGPVAFGGAIGRCASVEGGARGLYVILCGEPLLEGFSGLVI